MINIYTTKVVKKVDALKVSEDGDIESLKPLVIGSKFVGILIDFEMPNGSKVEVVKNNKKYIVPKSCLEMVNVSEQQENRYSDVEEIYESEEPSDEPKISVEKNPFVLPIETVDLKKNISNIKENSKVTMNYIVGGMVVGILFNMFTGKGGIKTSLLLGGISGLAMYKFKKKI